MLKRSNNPRGTKIRNPKIGDSTGTRLLGDDRGDRYPYREGGKEGERNVNGKNVPVTNGIADKNSRSCEIERVDKK